MSLLPAGGVLSAFVLASFVLAVTPGPGVFYIVTRSLAEGRRAGLCSVLGVALGNLGNAVGTAAGLAAVFSASSAAFELTRYLGAAYLVYLGWKAVRAGPRAPRENGRSTRLPHGKVIRDGLVIALLNPKTALFFAAFLPQFVTTQTSHPLQTVALGVAFVAIAAFTDLLYALFASLAAPALVRMRAAIPITRYLTGCAYLGLGLFTAVSGIRGER